MHPANSLNTFNKKSHALTSLVYAIPKFNVNFCDLNNYYFMETLRLSPNTGVGKLFTRTATFESILKPRAALIGRAKKKKVYSTRPQMSYFLLKISKELKVKGLRLNSR